MPYADNNAIYISASSILDVDAERSFDRPCSVMADDARRYFMRARNTALSSYVYWYVDNSPDILGYSSGYSPGDLADISVVRIEEAPVNGPYTSATRFTSYQDVITYLSTRTSAYKEVVPLYKKGYPGDPNYVIGSWQWNSDPSPVITPVGPVRFDLVTDGGYGVVLSVDGPTTLTLVGGHTLGSVGYVLAWDTSAGVELLARSSFTRVVDSVTVSSTTGMAAGDQIYQWDTSEFVIGGSTRDVRLEANTTCKFSSGLVLTGRAVLGLAGVYKRSRLVASISSYTPLSASGKRVLVGWQLATGLNRGGGFSRGAAPTVFGAYEEDTVLTTSASVVVSAASVAMSHYGRIAPVDQYIPGVDSSAYVGGTTLPYVTYATAVPYLCADDGAIFSGLSSETTAVATVAYTNYSDVLAFLTLQGNTYKQAVPLYKKGYAGNPAYIIGQWKWSNDVSPIIAPIGEVLLGSVTPSQYGVVDSVTNPTTLILVAGHSLTSGSVSALDATSGVEHYWDVMCSVVGDTVTMPSTAGLAAGDVIMRLGVSEFTIGGSSRDLIVDSGTPPIFAGYLQVQNGATRLPFPLDPYKWRIRASISLVDATPTNGSILGFGAYWSAIKCYGGGQARLAGVYKFSIFSGSPSSVTVGAAAETPTGGTEWIVERQYVQPFGEYTAITEYQSTGKGASVSHGANNASPVSPLIVARPGGAEIVAIRITDMRLE